GLDSGVDGMVHLSDLDWNRSGEDAIKDYKKGDVVKAVVLEADAEKERISLGIKQLGGDPLEGAGDLRKGARVTCEVTDVKDNGLEVRLTDSGMTSFIRRSDLSRDRSEQRTDRFAPGEKVDAVITQIDKASRKVSVSIKALEIAEEKEAVKQYGSTDSGASLGDILGAALDKAKEEGGEEKPAAKAKSKKKDEPEAEADTEAKEPTEDAAEGGDAKESK
ncbi:MAG: S1 RNA-binding domain-containing protein, partial [Pirellulales bacterium]|nr:S1 RNA-binding domain-containing protein [Pirellulales bacterium]